MFSELLTRWFQNATHQGPPQAATHFGASGEPGMGPWLQLWFDVESDVVRAARWATYGCPTSIGCAEAVCTVSEGRELDRVRALTASDVATLVGGVPEGKEHCARLAADAISNLRPHGPRGATG